VVNGVFGLGGGEGWRFLAGCYYLILVFFGRMFKYYAGIAALQGDENMRLGPILVNLNLHHSP
jgi:hypothetical protein